MKRREWSVPARESAQGAQSSDASEQSRRGFIKYVVHFILFMIFFGVIGFLFSSWFPVALGLFLFFTDGDFIEWVLWKVGIRLVPDTLGPEFIKAFVFLFGLWILLAYWRDSAPAWLSPWIPPSASWYFIAGAAFGCAVLQIISVAVVKKLLPQFGIDLAPGRQGLAILVVLGMLIGLVMLAFLIFGY
jgi:hypothetical protein